MPTFTSVEAIVADIKAKMPNAIKQAQEEVYKVIDRYIKTYYAEYSPEFYDRTYQLFNSLVKTEIIPSGNGFKAQVYFDVDSLDYKPSWSGEKTMQNAGYGMHATYPKRIPGTPIWLAPTGELDATAMTILKEAIIAAGIPVK